MALAMANVFGNGKAAFLLAMAKTSARGATGPLTALCPADTTPKGQVCNGLHSPLPVQIPFPDVGRDAPLLRRIGYEQNTQFDPIAGSRV